MTNSVSIEGRITIENSDEMRRKLRAVLRSQPGQVTIDLSGATFMDTSAVATLLEAARIARGQDTRLVLAGLHGQPAQLFELSLLHPLFEIAK